MILGNIRFSNNAAFLRWLDWGRGIPNISEKAATFKLLINNLFKVTESFFHNFFYVLLAFFIHVFPLVYKFFSLKTKLICCREVEKVFGDLFAMFLVFFKGVVCLFKIFFIKLQAFFKKTVIHVISPIDIVLKNIVCCTNKK
eukprot:gnl/Chilomastix_cuspidata/9593.p1 GENE.gnl/Chilomastix_cuspidata/9593~~gnl/Chilomastix_cuspidata/9593.p1  ORF type:complete len:142 (-),score=9.77 gnl/Chilomastix_cuspidata/9593:16-441(-)